MLDFAMRAGLTSIVQKLILMVHRMPAGAQANAMTRQELTVLAGLTDAELNALNELQPGEERIASDNTGITANGVPVKHNHERRYTYNTTQRPLMIRTNTGVSSHSRI